MFCLNMLRMSLELSRHDPAYEDMAIKFFDHFLHIARRDDGYGQEGLGLWDDEDNFFYDLLCMPSGRKIPLRLRSMVGLIPLFAVGCVEQEMIDEMPELWRRFELYRERRTDLVKLVSRWNEPGAQGRRLICAGARLPHDEAFAAHARRDRIPLAIRRQGALPQLPRSSL